MAGKSTSIPEQAIFYYVKRLYQDAQSRFKVAAKNGKKYEADIFIPSINVAIEYNGDHWHSGRESRDIEKNLVFSELGVFLIVILEGSLKDREIRNGVALRHSVDGSPGLHMNEVIENTIHVLAAHTEEPMQKQHAKVFSLSYEQYCDDYPDIVKPIFSSYCEDNISCYCAFSGWDEEKNRGIDPKMIPVKTSAKFWYRCPCGYEFRIAPRDYPLNLASCKKHCDDCAYNVCPFISACPVFTKWEKGHLPVPTELCQYIQDYTWGYVLRGGNWPNKYGDQIQMQICFTNTGFDLELLRKYFDSNTPIDVKNRILNVFYAKDNLPENKQYSLPPITPRDYVYKTRNADTVEDLALCKKVIEILDWTVIIYFANFQDSEAKQKAACEFLDWTVNHWKQNGNRLTRFLQLVSLPFCSGGLEKDFEASLRNVLEQNRIAFDLPIFGATPIRG